MLTTGLNGYLLEWNILDGTVKTKFNANAAIWNSQLVGKHMYLACEDGSIKIVKVKKDSFVLLRTLQRTETRCLSLQVSQDESNVFAGYADGSIRRWDLKSNNCTLHI